jgi:hypothetical protein
VNAKAAHTQPAAGPRQRCHICAIVEDLIDCAEADLQVGRVDDVAEALAAMRMHITGGLFGTPRVGR